METQVGQRPSGQGGSVQTLEEQESTWSQIYEKKAGAGVWGWVWGACQARRAPPSPALSTLTSAFPGAKQQEKQSGGSKEDADTSFTPGAQCSDGGAHGRPGDLGDHTQRSSGTLAS